MEENAPSTPPAQPNEPVPSRDFKPMLLSGLVVVILALLGGIFFFDQIKTLFNKKSLPQSPGDVLNQLSPTVFPTIDPRIVCARFTNLENALLNIEKACALDLSNQNLTSLPDKVLQLTKLDTIVLNNNSFSNFPDGLTTISTLVEIDIVNNKISNIPVSISQLQNLQKIDLTGNNLSSGEVQKIKNALPKALVVF